MTRPSLIFVCAAWLLVAGCGTSQPIDAVEWTVMGTVARVQTRGPADKATVAAVQDAFARVNRLLNAHDPESELSRLAGLADDAILAQCDPEMRPCYEAAFQLRDETDGLFNPRWKGAGTMDLGGIAKGFAVDLAAAALAGKVAQDTLLDLGGNLKAVRGTWRIGVYSPDGGAALPVRTLAPGASCATSARYFRGDHIRDGRTGAAAAGELTSATVVHPTSAMRADGLSTTLFLLGRDAGERFLAAHDPAATAIWL